MILLDMLDSADAELRSYADRLSDIDADDLARPTPCAGWDVAALSDHLARVAFQQAEAFHRARYGGREAPSPLSLVIDATEIPALLHATCDHLGRIVKGAGDRRWAPVPLPFATLPAPAAAAALMIEYGIHRHDLGTALGDIDVALTQATTDALMAVGNGLLLLLARPIDADPCAFRLEAPEATLTVAWDGARWSNDVPDHTTLCRFTGSGAALSLLALHRIDVDDPSVEVDDPSGLAGQFRQAIGPL